MTFTESNLIDKIAEIVGRDNVSNDRVDLIAYSRDASPEPARIPRAVVRPGSAEEVSRILRLANEMRFSVVPRGGGTAAGGAGTSIRGDGVIIDLKRLDNVLEMSEADLSVTVQAGCSWGKLDHELAARGYRPPFWGPESAYAATVGGSVSCASMSSQGATVAGSAADEVIALEVVLPTGEIIHTGSDSLPNAGPFARICNGGDFAGIFTGSLGVFGILTTVTMRIEPLPKVSRYAAHTFPNWSDGIQFALRMLHNKIPEVLSVTPGRRSVKRSWGEDADCALKFVIEEQDERIADRKLELSNKLAEECHGDRVPDGSEKTERWWRNMFMRLVEDEHKRKAFAAHGCHRVPLRKLPIAAQEAEKYFLEESRVGDYGMDVTLGSYVSDMRPICSFYPMLFFKDEPETRRIAWKIWDGWLERAITRYGASPYWMGHAWARHLVPKLRPENRKFLLALKKALDPNNVLNPGLLLPPYQEEM